MILKVGVVGVGAKKNGGVLRGRVFLDNFRANPDCKISAICDTNSRALEEVSKEYELASSQCYTNYDEFLDSDLDIVAIATPPMFHVEQSIKALENGQHVICEVPALWKAEEAEELVTAVEKSGKQYMLAENCCYMAVIASWREMICQGRLGKPIYAESDYIQDCRDIMIDSNGNLTWRASMPPMYYCTHALGPLLDLLEDRCISVSGVSTGKNVAPELGAIDMEVAIFNTEKGAAIKLLTGFSVVRSPWFIWYSIYGTRGVLEAPRCGWDHYKGYFADVPNLHDNIQYPLSWEYPEDIAKHIDAPASGFGVADYLMTKDFVEAVKYGKTPPIDVHKAVDYSLPGILAHLSTEKGGQRIDIPDFR